VEPELKPAFEKFITERRYLQNVSQKTIEWYRQSLRWLGIEHPTEDELKEFVIKMRSKGLKATGCNCKIRAVNVYMHWLSGNTGKCSPQCKHPRLAKLKEPQLVLPTYGDDDIRRLIQWRPESWYQRRTHVLILALIDIGARISELLTLRWDAVDFDNLLITLDGKGGKQRVVPFSMELRASLWKWKKDAPKIYVFGTKTMSLLGYRNAMRDVTELLASVSITVPMRRLHAFRHTFATAYLKRGGNVVYLQRSLGHADIAMTMRYVHLQTADLQRVHAGLSMLSSERRTR
jgi:integrase/recombinase XerD